MRIGLVPMSAKPYHKGHHWLVIKAASENDRVIVFVSTSDRKKKGEFPILGEDMLKIWKEELELIMPPNVELIYGGSPVRNVYTTISAAIDANTDNDPATVNNDNIYSVYSDATDTPKNYPEKSRQKYMQPLYGDGFVRFPAEINPESFTRGVDGEGAPNISGTAMRNAISENDFESFAAGLPEDVNSSNVWNILTKQNLDEYLYTGGSTQMSKKLNENDDDLILGTEEYNQFIDEVIQNLSRVKRSLRVRSTPGKVNRKEAAGLQHAINALKHLQTKSTRILQNSNTLNERIVRFVAPETSHDESEEKFDHKTLKEFFRKFR